MELSRAAEQVSGILTKQPPPPEVKEQSLQLQAEQITVVTEGIQILIPIKLVQETFQHHMNQVLSAKDSYNNPIKKAVDDMLSSYNSKNKELLAEFNKLIETTMRSYMATPGFHLQLGQAMAEEMAKEAVKKNK